MKKIYLWITATRPFKPTQFEGKIVFKDQDDKEIVINYTCNNPKELLVKEKVIDVKLTESGKSSLIKGEISTEFFNKLPFRQKLICYLSLEYILETIKELEKHVNHIIKESEILADDTIAEYNDTVSVNQFGYNTLFEVKKRN
jgi:hypothetical protein